ncbi:hypothetical protein [uncultured Clostridium sp.]|uniref:hypothetical protein n=1 Tax=uncultured Clostridium sp. TaxID=59620 RepID=UPI002631358E|nr:hypothetical protein [uncultured Clostridium sp.]
MNECCKCNSKNTSWLSHMDDFEEGSLCWFVCLECGHMFMDIEEVEEGNNNEN